MSSWRLPTRLEVGGKAYPIHSDYRDILDILHRLNDASEPEFIRWRVALALFYEGDLPRSDYPEAMQKLADFLNCGQTLPRSPAPPLLDWEQDAPLTILHMSIYHGLEDAMNAGLDAAIGDYVYEFDSTELCYAPTLIMQAYRAALDGSDIVSVCPRTVRGGSSLFYKVFNAHSQSAYRLRTDAFRLVTRRAINRVHASSTHLPYRKAAYAASGLRMVDPEFDGQLTVKQKGRFNLALDSLTLYTNFGFKASVTVTLCMMALALAELIYTLVIFATGHPVEGWTTTMFVITVGFAGLFAVLTIVVKYLSLLLNLTFRQQKYLVESIEKLQK